MALQNILDAIVREADERIAHEAAKQRADLKRLREESERRLAAARTQIADQKERKIRQIREKAEARGYLLQRQALLAKKQECMDRLYGMVMDSLLALPARTTESFLKHCLSVTPGKGVVRATKNHEAIIKKLLPKDCEMGATLDARGGFRFSSDREEYNFSYEFLIESVLRPLTDVTSAHDLFSDL